MPIRMFESYGHEKVLQKVPISTLDSTIFAIDGFWYLKKYLSIASEEQFLDTSLAIDTLLKNLIELNKKTTVLWVWDGIEFKQPFQGDLSSFCRDVSDKIIISSGFNKRLYDQEFYVAYMTERLQKNGIAFMRAPYSAAAQCVYFSKYGKVSVFSKNDALLFADCNKLIVDIEFENSSVDIIYRDVLFKECNLNLESFRRLALLSGCEYCATYPSFASGFDATKAIELMSKNTVENNSAKDYQMSPESRYFNDYKQGFYIVESRPIMGLDGVVSVIRSTASSESLEELYGKQLPNKIYQALFKCQIGAKSLGIALFNRVKPYTVPFLLELFKTLLDNPKAIDYIKVPTISEFFIQKLQLEIVWHSMFNKATQILFFIFLNGDFNPEFVLRFLNSGYLGIRPLAPESVSPNEKFLHLSTKYSPEGLENFCMFLENHILFMDTASLLRIYHEFKNDVNFNFTLGYFMAELEKPTLKQFIQSQNLASSKKLDEILKLLED